MLLAGDIGGTKTELACFDVQPAGLRLVAEERFASPEHRSLEEIISLYLAKHQLTVDQAGFGVAGPVVAGRATTTNLPWVIEADSLARLLGLPRVALVNDLEAIALAVTRLAPDDLASLNPGSADATGSIAVIAAGTGLGEAGLFWDGQRHRAFASEGGHSSFAPRTDLEDDLLRYLRGQFGHVSYERVLSGPGLVNVYTFLRDRSGAPAPAWLATAMSEGDPAAAISTAGVERTDPVCEQALDLFVSVYGAQAGNLALTLASLGGVYVAGGIAPKILPKLRQPAFMDAFLDKGRLRPMLEAMPVRVVLNERTPLLGAARAAQLA
jgi:glucokinase